MEEKQNWRIEIRFLIHGTFAEAKEKASAIAQIVGKRPEVIGDAEVDSIVEEDFDIDDFEEDLHTTIGSEIRKPTRDDSDNG